MRSPSLHTYKLHPTANRSKYLVLKLNFSGISADPEKIQYTKGTTELRRLVIVFREWELLRVVEV